VGTSSYRVFALNLPLPRDVFSEDYFAQLLPSLAPEVQPLIWEFPLLKGRCDLLCRFRGRLALAELEIVGPDSYRAGLAQLSKYAGAFRRMLDALGVALEFDLLLLMGVPKGMERYVQSGPFSVEGLEVEVLKVGDLRARVADEVDQLLERRSVLVEEVKRLEEKVAELQKAVARLDVKKVEKRVEKLIEEKKKELEDLRGEAHALKIEISRLKERRLELFQHRNAVYLREDSSWILVGWLKNGAFTPHENYKTFLQD